MLYPTELRAHTSNDDTNGSGEKQSLTRPSAVSNGLNVSAEAHVNITINLKIELSRDGLRVSSVEPTVERWRP